MPKGSRKNPPGDLVRFTPKQFSVAVCIVVCLSAGAFLLGYRFGIESTMATTSESEAAPEVEGPGKSEAGQRPAPAATVTFYRELTKPPTRERQPAPGPPDIKDPEKPEADVKPGPRGAAEAGETSSGSSTTRLDNFMVQVASYAQSEKARSLLTTLSGHGYAGTVIRADLGERGVWFRVRVGPYRGREKAREAQVALQKKEGLKGYVVR